MHSGTWARAALLLAASLLAGTGVWLAASWVDTSYDATCGAVIHPDAWLGEEDPGECRAVMEGRAAGSAFAVVLAGVLVAFALRRHPVSPAVAAMILIAVVSLTSLVVLVNEMVRSDGAL